MPEGPCRISRTAEQLTLGLNRNWCRGRAQSPRHHVQISVHSHSEARNRSRLPTGGDLREMVLK